MEEDVWACMLVNMVLQILAAAGAAEALPVCCHLIACASSVLARKRAHLYLRWAFPGQTQSFGYLCALGNAPPIFARQARVCMLGVGTTGVTLRLALTCTLVHCLTLGCPRGWMFPHL